MESLRGVRGHKQKIAASGVASSSTRAAGSSLASKLLAMWAWGELSVSTVQKLAASGVEDGVDREDLLKLARIGNSGALPGNCHRDLTSCLAAPALEKAASKSGGEEEGQKYGDEVGGANNVAAT